VSSRIIVVALVLSSVSAAVLHGTVCAQHSREAEDALGAAGHRAAKSAFEQGREAFDAGRYDEAIERFERAYELSGRPELLFNVGLAADRLREDERALSAFERYLEQAVDPLHREQVEQRVAALRSARARAEQRERARARAAALNAPTPKQTARAAAIEGSGTRERTRSTPNAAPHGATRDTGDGGGLLSEWWFWTGAAVLVAGGAATAYLLTRPGDGPALPEPNTGVVVSTLRLAP
jgi:tetratricopeptide (TPR) repeat protein